MTKISFQKSAGDMQKEGRKRREQNFQEDWYADFIAIDMISVFPADRDIFKMSSGRLKKVTMSYDQTRRSQDV